MPKYKTDGGAEVYIFSDDPSWNCVPCLDGESMRVKLEKKGIFHYCERCKAHPQTGNLEPRRVV